MVNWANVKEKVKSGASKAGSAFKSGASKLKDKTERAAAGAYLDYRYKVKPKFQIAAKKVEITGRETGNKIYKKYKKYKKERKKYLASPEYAEKVRKREIKNAKLKRSIGKFARNVEKKLSEKPKRKYKRKSVKRKSYYKPVKRKSGKRKFKKRSSSSAGPRIPKNYTFKKGNLRL